MISIVTLALTAATLLTTCCVLHNQRKLRRSVDEFADMIAGIYAHLDYLKEATDNNLKALQHILDRQELHIAIDKYNLSITRLQLIELRQNAVENEDYEGAATVSKSIEVVEKLLASE